MGQSCDDDCCVVLNKNNLKVIKNNEIVLEGKHTHSDGLWDITIHYLQEQLSFILPKTHPGLYGHRNNKLNIILSNTPKTLPSHKSKNAK